MLPHVLVAGDIYDMEALSPRSLNQPLERMRNFSGVQWHLLPGNHDPHRRTGCGISFCARGCPTTCMSTPRRLPAIFEDEGIAILPAPLHHRRTLDDPTAWMDEADLPDGLIRIGLAHGTVTGFGSEDKDVPNYIAPDRPARAGSVRSGARRLAWPEADQRSLLVQRHARNGRAST
ncbi:MAG: metallophosphoesterase [Halofilum sp. (in: g-proteobacteria)]|nr:metallophosphoesterase [Halofilum sp. (in: g-proteobacteria)]